MRKGLTALAGLIALTAAQGAPGWQTRMNQALRDWLAKNAA